MTGIDAATGRALGGRAHLRQSVRDILTTPVGSRVLLRAYGSRISELVDRPLGRELLASVQAEAADALARWEPRLQLRRIRAERLSAGGGQIVLSLDGDYLDGGTPSLVRLEATVFEAAPPISAPPALPGRRFSRRFSRRFA